MLLIIQLGGVYSASSEISEKYGVTKYFFINKVLQITNVP